MRRGGGTGRSRRVTSVMMASVPWLPTNRCVSDVAGDVLDVPAAGPDARVPSASTTSSESTDSRVWPYFTQHRPPALVPRLPPIEHISQLAGSGG